MSLVATFDDLMRCMAVLIDGTAEEGLKSIFLERNVIISTLHKFTEFLKFVKVQEECRMQWLAAIQEAQRLQRELDASLQNMADLEAKLYHARKLIESEHKARKEAENERDNIVSILGIIISGIGFNYLNRWIFWCRSLQSAMLIEKLENTKYSKQKLFRNKLTVTIYAIFLPSL